jgi:ribonuclease D
MIQTEAAIKTLVERALKAPRVAIDTEFIWERTFYPKLGIIQVGFSERDCELIDALALPTLPYLGELLASTHTEKILHDAQQDLSILSRITGVCPKTIFDTRRGAGFSGLPSTTSLLALLRDVMNIEIPKTETRSNWLRRPLTENQIAYALNDVRFLPELRDVLVEQATAAGNGDYLREEMQLFDAPDFYRELSPNAIFNRMKMGRLKADESAILQGLVEWREKVARTRDMPRGHILRDAELIALARHKPDSRAALSRIEKLPQAAATRYATQLLEIVATSTSASQQSPDRNMQGASRLPRELQSKVPARIEAMQKAATDAAIDPALVASKAAMTALIAAEHATPQKTHALQTGWRKHFVS